MFDQVKFEQPANVKICASFLGDVIITTGNNDINTRVLSVVA